MLRRKSGNYTVRRPLEIGAAMAGCRGEVIDALSGYGAAIGEAFQLRDDVLGVFGSPSLTGKLARTDMEAHKATSVIVAAYELADPALRRQLSELMSIPEIDAARRRPLAQPDRRQRCGAVDRGADRRAVPPGTGVPRCRNHSGCAARRTGRHGRRLHGSGLLMRTVERRTDRVVVVGAGLSGLSAALQLAGRGRAVTVLERGEHPGGRVGRADIAGYRLDTGPTVLTMPDIIDDAFAAVGESMADHLVLDPVHPAYRAEFADGSALAVHTEATAMAAEIERFAGRSGSRRLPAAARLADQAVPHRVRRVHRRQLRLAAVAADPAAGPAGRARRFPPLGTDGAPVPSTTNGCCGCSRSRRSTPGCRRRARWRCTR